MHLNGVLGWRMLGDSAMHAVNLSVGDRLKDDVILNSSSSPSLLVDVSGDERARGTFISIVIDSS